MNLKKLLALLLALVMVFALAACGDDVSNDDDDDKESTSMSSDPTGTTDSTGNVPGDDGPKDSPPTTGSDEPLGPLVPAVSVVGKWRTSMEVDAFTMGLEGVDAKYFLYMDLTFDRDGDYLMDVDEEATVATMGDGFKNAVVDYLVNQLYAQFGGEAEAEAACQAENGMSCREYAVQYTEELIPTLKDMLAELVFPGKYELKDGKLFMDEGEMTYSLEDEKLKLFREGWALGGMEMGERVFLLVDADPVDINPEDYESKEELLPPAQAVVGKWECTLALEGKDMGLADFEGAMFFDFTFAFNADGTYSVTLDKDGLIASLKEFEAEMVQYSVDLFYAQMQNSGMSREEADAAAQAYYGKTIQEYFQEEVAKQNLMEKMTSSLGQTDGSGTYVMDGNNLTMTNEAGKAVLYTVELMSNDCILLDSDDATFIALMAQFGEDYMFLFREV